MSAGDRRDRAAVELRNATTAERAAFAAYNRAPNRADLASGWSAAGIRLDAARAEHIAAWHEWREGKALAAYDAACDDL